jgi:hypothetical protein
MRVAKGKHVYVISCTYKEFEALKALAAWSVNAITVQSNRDNHTLRTVVAKQDKKVAAVLARARFQQFGGPLDTIDVDRSVDNAPAATPLPEGYVG